MFDAIKPLLDSGLINEDVSRELNEAWESRLNEAREQVRAELREEFAQRYEHDRTVMVEALDRMVQTGLRDEIQGLAEERRQLAEDRVKFQGHMRESATRFNDFMTRKLAEEIGELRRDRRNHQQGLGRLERFVIEALAQEIREFAQDREAVIDTRVRLVREGRERLDQLQRRFVRESSRRVSHSMSQWLGQELNQLREDIQAARENQFGRRIFEAYAAEFGTTYLNENAEIRRLRGIMESQEQELGRQTQEIEQAHEALEVRDQRIRQIQEHNQRQEIMTELLATLTEDRRGVMKDLLESVQTPRLKNAFEKYLPAVLTENRTPRGSVPLRENLSSVTGDKNSREAASETTETTSNVVELKRLAGL